MQNEPWSAAAWRRFAALELGRRFGSLELESGARPPHSKNFCDGPRQRDGP